MYNNKETPKNQVRTCDAPDCLAEADCRAPKSREVVDGRTPQDYYWFCAPHAREYNQKWDYFSGMSSEEILAFQKDAVTGHRPTWNYHIPPHLAAEMVNDRLRTVFGADLASASSIPSAPPIPAKHRKALDVLALKHPCSQKEIRSQYRLLVKQYHPDVNGGDKQAEERFKLVGQAYQLLKKEYKGT